MLISFGFYFNVILNQKVFNRFEFLTIAGSQIDSYGE